MKILQNYMTPLQNSNARKQPMEILHDFYLINPKNPTSFLPSYLIDSWNFLMLFLRVPTPENAMYLTLMPLPPPTAHPILFPLWIFSRIG